MSQREPVVKNFEVVGETARGGNYRITVYRRGSAVPVDVFDRPTMAEAEAALTAAGYQRPPAAVERFDRAADLTPEQRAFYPYTYGCAACGFACHVEAPVNKCPMCGGGVRRLRAPEGS